MPSEPRGCLPGAGAACRHALAALRLRHPVHPAAPAAPADSEFFAVGARLRVRVLRMAPDAPRAERASSARASLSEEYWFSKSTKPLRIGSCNCSFRRSHRLSVLSHQSVRQKVDETRASFSMDVVPKRIVNVDTFVDRILQETLFEAFHECYMMKPKSKINVAYSKDEVDSEEEDMLVTLRRNVVKNPVTKLPLMQHRVSCHYKNRVQKKPAIMLFHGIGNSADAWSLVVQTLVKRGFEVIAPDMLGHGFSSAPNKSSSYTFHNLLLHAITIFDHYIGVDEKRKCILVGHSYGCSIVSALYRHRAPQITQLVLISGGGPTPLAAPVNSNEISPFGCVHALFKPLLLCGVKRSFFFSSRGKHFELCDPEPGIPEQVLKYLSKGQNWPEGDAAFHRRILVPTLLVHGLQDTHVTLVQQCEMERTIPRAFLELIPNAGHMPMLETPEHLSHMILCFIDTWS